MNYLLHIKILLLKFKGKTIYQLHCFKNKRMKAPISHLHVKAQQQQLNYAKIRASHNNYKYDDMAAR